jgi:hypothetical protein
VSAVCGGTGYLFWHPAEVLERVRRRGITSGNPATATVFLPDNCRRIQIMASTLATFTITDLSDIAGMSPSLVPPGRWIEVPPGDDRVVVNTANPETVHVTCLCGPAGSFNEG